MRSREGDKRPCVHCGQLTTFQFDLRGPRGGHIRWEDTCTDCGERPTRRNYTYRDLLKKVKV